MVLSLSPVLLSHSAWQIQCWFEHSRTCRRPRRLPQGAPLGSDTLNTLSKQTGLSGDELLAGVSQNLPDDQLTPKGRLPTEEEAGADGLCRRPRRGDRRARVRNRQSKISAMSIAAATPLILIDFARRPYFLPSAGRLCRRKLLCRLG